MRKQGEKLTYKSSGVDIHEADALIRSVKKYIEKTYVPGVISQIGGFSSFFSLDVNAYREPVLLASTDGVGTKLKIAFAAGKYREIGIDLVAMCVNDIAANGGKPLFFLDYFATGKLESTQARDVIRGIAKGCEESGCALVGGETAEMPSFYRKGEFDLAGFCVGIAEKSDLVTGERIRGGDLVIGIPSNGFHSNGYSLIRKILFSRMGLSVTDAFPGMKSPIHRILLKPTRIYVKTVLDLVCRYEISGMAHITGGGFYDNIGRILPDGLGAQIDSSSWKIPRIFNTIMNLGNIEPHEMFRTFNMGMGFVLIAPEKEAKKIVRYLRKGREKASIIGSILPVTNVSEKVEVIFR